MRLYGVELVVALAKQESAFSMYMTASKLNYWNTYSEKCVIPKILKALW